MAAMDDPTNADTGDRPMAHADPGDRRTADADAGDRRTSDAEPGDHRPRQPTRLEHAPSERYASEQAPTARGREGATRAVGVTVAGAAVLPLFGGPPSLPRGALPLAAVLRVARRPPPPP